MLYKRRRGKGHWSQLRNNDYCLTYFASIKCHRILSNFEDQAYVNVTDFHIVWQYQVQQYFQISSSAQNKFLIIEVTDFDNTNIKIDFHIFFRLLSRNKCDKLYKRASSQIILKLLLSLSASSDRPTVSSHSLTPHNIQEMCHA